MKRVLVWVLWISLLLSSCGPRDINIEKQNIKEQPNITNNKNKEKVSEKVIEKSDIKSLLKEGHYSLKIKEADGRFLKANSYFTHRLLEVLSQDQESQWRDRELDDHQLVFKFEGYKAIHVNTDLESFWFEGKDKLYHAKGIKDLWSRYIIKMIDDEPVYAAFEKTVFSEMNYDMDGDNKKDRTLLFYDGDIRLKVKDTEVVIEKGYGERLTFQSIKQYFTPSVSKRVSLEYIDYLNLLVYIGDSFGADGLYQNVRFYKYSNGEILKIWSNSDIDYEIQSIDLEKGKMVIRFPFANQSYEVKMNDDELKTDRRILNDYLENKFDYDPMKHFQKNITIESRRVEFVDYDNDEELEMLILGDIEPAKGAMPPRVGQIRDRIIYVFELLPDQIQCTDLIMERDAHSSNSLFKYFDIQ